MVVQLYVNIRNTSYRGNSNNNNGSNSSGDINNLYNSIIGMYLCKI